MRRALTLALAAGLWPSLASAAEGPAEEPDARGQRTDFTAYTRESGQVAVGPLKAEFGVIDEVTIGTYVPPWFAFTVIGAPAPNLYLKARSWWSGPLTLAVRGGFLYIDGSGIDELADADASANATVITGEVDASLLLNPRVRLSVGFDYAYVVAVGGGEEVATSIEGASVATTGSARLFGQWRLTRVFGLTFLARYVAFQNPVGADVSTESPGITVEGDLSGERSSSGTRYAVVPGVSFDWTHWEFYLGVGYGTLQIPALGLPTTRALPVVDFALAFKFDIY